jgi:hypothetical protein
MTNQANRSPRLTPSVTAPGTLPAPPQDADGKESGIQQAFLWHTHDYLGDYARFADTKAAFAGTLAGALVGCLYGAGLFAQLVKTSIPQWTWVMWITASAGLISCVAIFLSVLVVYPRLRRSKKIGFIFWESIAAFGSAAKYRAAFRDKNEDELSEALQQQIFDVAKFVLVPKYRRVSLCLSALVIGAMLSGVALLYKDSASVKTAPAAAPPPTNSHLP